jgi:hypothetical protein
VTINARNVRFALFATVALLVLAAVGAAQAGNGKQAPGGGGGSSSGSSLSLVVLDSPDGLPHFRGKVTFNVTTSASMPQVNLDCYQGGTWVLDDWRGFSPGAWLGTTFSLGPNNYWTSGAADCTARLVTFNKRGVQSTLATTSFHVYA